MFRLSAASNESHTHLAIKDNELQPDHSPVQVHSVLNVADLADFILPSMSVRVQRLRLKYFALQVKNLLRRESIFS